MANLPQIPSFLGTPPTAIPNPPVVSHRQELPFGELTWEDFEKLCVRLARSESEVEHCQLYGTRGQQQEGIDVYARLATNQRYVVYQCKRVANFTASDITHAVQAFLAGAWAGKASQFVLCTQVSLEPRSLADEFEKQATALRARNISLLAWDSRQLSGKLKDDPKVVNDFFGKAWLSSFCGAEAADLLRNRLDATQVAEFRRNLGQFYTHVFNVNDPASEATSSTEIRLLPIDQRFIVPDIEEQQTITTSMGASPAPQLHRELPGIPTASVKARLDAQTHLKSLQRTIRRRLGADEWLGASHKHIILGGPGSGKSTLLRFIITDLLKDQPELGSLALKWGSHLPIWLPFPAWTEKIRHHQECSLPDLLKDHLRIWAEERLWPIVEKALEDDRLLLVVDGLDEWVDQNCAQRAVDKLQVFVAQRDVPTIVASRPHGFAKLGWQQTGWQTGQLAPFNRTQQKKFASAWFKHRALMLQHPESQATLIASREADSFVNELSANANLRELAGIPLLLRIFVYFRLRNTALPQNRFEAYDRMVNQLISEHPSNRQRAADIADTSELDSEDIRTALGMLAFEIQSRETGGVISKDRARSIIESHLKDAEHGPGLDSRLAVRLSKKLLEIGENTLGVLVERTPADVGFFHRSFQEYLAANHVSKMLFDAQLKLVNDFCADAQWSEVILALCYMTRRPAEVRSLVEALRGHLATASRADRYPVERLVAEIAFGTFSCPTPIAREVASNVFEQIGVGDWMPQRISLTQLALGGLRSTALRDILRDRINRWFPCYSRWRGDLLNTLTSWEPSSELLECLWKNLFDEELSNRRGAASAISTRYREDVKVGDRIASLANGSISTGPRVAAIEALFTGWPKHPDLSRILDNVRDSVSPELRLVSILGRIQLQKHTEEDLDELLRLSGDSMTSIFWRDDIISALVSGWPRSTKVKALCRKALSDNIYHYRHDPDREIAEAVLVRGFPQDDEVVDCLIGRAKRTDRSFLIGRFYELGPYFSRNFKRHPKLSAEIDEHLLKQKADVYDVDNAVLAMAAASDTAKGYLLNAVRSSPYAQWHAIALLDTWGMDDPSVSETLDALANGSPDKASSIAHLIPRIIEDKDAARVRLLELLKETSARRVDFIMSGLQSYSATEHNTEVVGTILDQINVRGEAFAQDVIGHLIADYAWDPRVRIIAQKEAATAKWTIRAIAAAYPNDPEFADFVFRAAAAIPTELRQVIVSDPSISIHDPAFAIDLFGKWEREEDAEVKTEASIRYYTLKSPCGVSETDLLSLQNGLRALGPDFEARRQAAIAGAIVLDRLDLIDVASTKEGDSSFTIGFTFYQNVALVRTLLQHWDLLKRKLGEKFWVFVGRFESDRLQLWSRFAPFLWEYESPRADALSFLSARSERDSTPEILQMLAAVPASRPLLLEYLMEALAMRAQSHREPLMNWFDGEAGRILIALCKGWPESEVIELIVQRLRSMRTKIGLELPVWHVICSKGSTESVKQNFDAILENYSEPNQFWDSQMARPLIRRLGKDDNLASIFEKQLQGSPTVVEKLSFSKLLAAARGVSATVRTWAVNEIDFQASNPSGPQIGIDYSTGKFEPVAHGLLEVLSAAA